MPDEQKPAEAPKPEASGWFDFKGADAAWDNWLGKRGLKCPIKAVHDELKAADARFDAYMDATDRRWGLRK